MGRTHVTPIKQPDNTSCGPSALKIALHILGVKKSVATLMDLCKTNRNGTTTKNLINAITGLGYPVLAVEYATLTHLQSALRYRSGKVRAVMVSYLYDLDKKNNKPHPDSGHWATVASYMANKSRIVLFDSATGKRKSYPWQNFRNRWMDYDLKRKKTLKTHVFKLVKHWQPQLMLIIARNVSDFPKFEIETSKLFLPKEE